MSFDRTNDNPVVRHKHGSSGKNPWRDQDGIMLNILKSSFLRQFAVGFALGAIGLVALHPMTTGEPQTDYAPTHVAR